MYILLPIRTFKYLYNIFDCIHICMFIYTHVFQIYVYCRFRFSTGHFLDMCLTKLRFHPVIVCFDNSSDYEWILTTAPYLCN